MKQKFAAILTCAMSSCSSGGPGRSNRLTPSGRNDPVSVTRGTRALVSPTRQFVSYVPAAGRLSVIDQTSEAEAYGVDFSAAVQASFPVARFDGVAALADNGLTIFSAGLMRSFAFQYSGGEWDYATEAPAFAFSEATGVRVIRHLDADTWQEEVLAGATPSALDAPVMNQDGTLLIMIRPESGAYAVYRAEETSSSIALALSCTAGAALESPIVALAMMGSQLFWGDGNGQLGVVNTSAAQCQQIGPKATLPDSTEVARIVPNSDGAIIVFGVGGKVYAWDGDQDIAAYSTLQSCDFPLAPMVLPDDEVAALCLNALDGSSDARTVVYESAAYQYYSKATIQAKYSLDLTLADVSGLGMDAASKRLFVLRNSAMGRLTVVDLPTGTSHDRRGLFIDGILRP